MHAAGIDEPIVDMNSIKEFIEAGADVILMPAVNTVPGLSEQEVTEACRYIKAHGALSLSAIGTSQEGADEGTIREIALLNKRCGIDIQHIGDAGYGGLAVVDSVVLLYLKTLWHYQLRFVVKDILIIKLLHQLIDKMSFMFERCYLSYK